MARGRCADRTPTSRPYRTHTRARDGRIRPRDPRNSWSTYAAALEVLDRELHRRVLPRVFVLRLDEDRLALALLREQRLPQPEQQPAVARVCRERVAKHLL